MAIYTDTFALALPMLLIAEAINILETNLDFEKLDFVLPSGSRSDILTSSSGRRAVSCRLIHILLACRANQPDFPPHPSICAFDRLLILSMIGEATPVQLTLMGRGLLRT